MPNLRQNLPLFLFTIAVFIFIPISILVKQKMGGDGVLYASVALNMARDIGSLWHPAYTPTVLTPFYDHPPLSMYINSWFFLAFGDNFIVDRLYCLATILLSLGGLVLIWRKIQPAAKYTLLWLPLLCWVLVPLTTRTFPANAIENLLVVFTTFGSWAILQSIYTTRKTWLAWLLLAALCITGAFFTNGLQAFFPLAIPFIYWLVFKQVHFKTMCWHTLCLTLFTAVCIGSVLLYKPAYQFTQHYFEAQIVSTFAGTRVGNGDYQGLAHLFGLLLIAGNLLPLIFFTAIIMCVLSKAKVRPFLQPLSATSTKKNMLFFALIALAASLPILSSSRQMAHYFTPSFPFWILLFLEILTPIFALWTAQINPHLKHYKIALTLSIILLCGAGVNVAYCYGRPWPVLVTVNTISKVVPDKSTLSVADDIWQNWNLHAYFYRYHQIALTTQPGEQYYLQRKSDTNQPADYHSVNLPLQDYTLFKRN